jgi:gliding motility-associatede transport system auxiliary component
MSEPEVERGPSDGRKVDRAKVDRTKTHRTKAEEREARGQAALSRWLAAAGVAAAVVIALCVNMLSSRHYRRWDATSAGLYTLSRVTEDSLRRLTEPVKIYVLLSSGDGLTLTLRHLLDAYRAISPNLSAEFIDPDQSPAEFLAIQQKYGVNAAKTEGGRVVTDANLIVVRGERKHFITADELFEVESGDAMRARPRVEKVVTTAIQQVTRGEAPKVCFTTGHGEPGFEDGGVEGLIGVRARLEKLNYEALPLPPVRSGGDASIDDCDLVVVPGPTLPIAVPDIKRLVRFVEGGGNALLFVGPEPAEGGGYVDAGLAPVMALAGVNKRGDIVFELEPSRKWPIGQGEAFLAEVKRHPITQGLVEVQGAIDVVVTVSSSLEILENASAAPNVILTSTERAFGMRDFEAWAASRREPEPGPGDSTGPLILATATELPRADSSKAHGSRIVVMGTKSAIVGANWSNERLQGTALFVESALSWLLAEPVILDIPNKPSRTVSAGLTEEVLSSAAMKVVLFLPLSIVLLGVAVRFRRRSSEGRRRKPDQRGDGPGDTDDGDTKEDAS